MGTQLDFNPLANRKIAQLAMLLAGQSHVPSGSLEAKDLRIGFLFIHFHS